MTHWQIQEVKQHLSEVIRLAQANGPQMITYRGEPRAWIISDKEYSQLTKQKESIVDFFQRSPHRDVKFQAERRKDLPRKVEL
jgi:prevent-host-death family protein